MDDSLKHRLEAMGKAASFAEGVVRRFGEWLEKAEDDELFRINPLQWAATHDIDDDEALELFLHATKTGIFEMSWGVICPHCGMLVTTPGGLRALGPNPHCRVCRVDVSGFLDDAVEVVFSLESGIRRLRYYDRDRIDLQRDGLKLFFSPSLKPMPGRGGDEFIKVVHEGFRVGLTLDPQQERTLTVDVGDHGVYAILAPTVHALSYLMTTDAGPTALKVDCLDGQFIPPEAEIGTGSITVTVKNRTDLLLPVCVMYLGAHDASDGDAPVWTYDPFLTGKRLLTNQTFRNLFRTETIGDQGLRIRNLAVVFTDLQASTALYERVGDIRALELVRRHFEELQDVVSRHRGALVKTIGDAVMAAFPEPERAVSAAAGMSRALRRLDADGESLVLKIGLHTGSCIAIQTNHQIDYFGRAVNVASRVQSVAAGGEIVVTDAVWESPGVPGLVQDYGLDAREDRVALRGIANDVHVYRLS